MLFTRLTSPDEVERALPDLARVYAAAFEEDATRFRDEQLPAHADRETFRLVVANDRGRIVGFAYGYTGRRGQWWTDYVRARVDAELAQRWLGGHWELVELAVHPEHQRRGIGGVLHDTLLDGLPHERALLATRRGDTPARRLYLRRGWRVLVDALDEEMSLLGLDLVGRRRV